MAIPCLLVIVSWSNIVVVLREQCLGVESFPLEIKLHWLALLLFLLSFLFVLPKVKREQAFSQGDGTE